MLVAFNVYNKISVFNSTCTVFIVTGGAILNLFLVQVVNQCLVLKQRCRARLL